MLRDCTKIKMIPNALCENFVSFRDTIVEIMEISIAPLVFYRN